MPLLLISHTGDGAHTTVYLAHTFLNTHYVVKWVVFDYGFAVLEHFLGEVCEESYKKLQN